MTNTWKKNLKVGSIVALFWANSKMFAGTVTGISETSIIVDGYYIFNRSSCNLERLKNGAIRQPTGSSLPTTIGEATYETIEQSKLKIMRSKYIKEISNTDFCGFSNSDLKKLYEIISNNEGGVET